MFAQDVELYNENVISMSNLGEIKKKDLFFYRKCKYFLQYYKIFSFPY